MCGTARVLVNGGHEWLGYARGTMSFWIVSGTAHGQNRKLAKVNLCALHAASAYFGSAASKNFLISDKWCITVAIDSGTCCVSNIKIFKREKPAVPDQVSFAQAPFRLVCDATGSIVIWCWTCAYQRLTGAEDGTPHYVAGRGGTE